MDVSASSRFLGCGLYWHACCYSWHAVAWLEFDLSRRLGLAFHTDFLVLLYLPGRCRMRARGLSDIHHTVYIWALLTCFQ